MMASTPKSKTTKLGLNWWERVVVKRCAGAINAKIDVATERSPFLTGIPLSVPRAEDDLALLYREEVRFGALLGSGTYSNVYEVAELDLLEESENAQEEIDNVMNGEARHALRQSIRTRGQHKDKAEFAIKHLKPELLKDTKVFEDAACDLIMEAKMLAKLSHPNILSLRAVAFDGAAAFARTGLYDSFFIVVERLDETLSDRLYRWRQEKIAKIDNDGNRTLAKTEIAFQVASALAYLHERRLVFRDLKPTNIGVKGEHVKLFDFGFCRELPRDPCSSITSSAFLESSNAPSPAGAMPELGEHDRLYGMSGKGTLMYMSPEVLGTRRYNQKADVYGWAMIFYEMLTLKKPFTIMSVEAHRQAIHQREERPPLEGCAIPKSIQKLLINCWHADTVHRFSMQEAKIYLDFIYSELSPGLLTAEGFHKCLKSTRRLLGPIQNAMSSFVSDMQTGYEDLVKDLSSPKHLAPEKEHVIFHTIPAATAHTGDSLSWASSISGVSFVEDLRHDDEERLSTVNQELNLADKNLEHVETSSLVAEAHEVLLVDDCEVATTTGGTNLDAEEASEEILAGEIGTNGAYQLEDSGTDTSAAATLLLEEDQNSILETSEVLQISTTTLQEGDAQVTAISRFEASRQRRRAPLGHNGTLVYHRYYGHVDRSARKADDDDDNPNEIQQERTLWSNHWTARAA